MKTCTTTTCIMIWQRRNAFTSHIRGPLVSNLLAFLGGIHILDRLLVHDLLTPYMHESISTSKLWARWRIHEKNTKQYQHRAAHRKKPFDLLVSNCWSMSAAPCYRQPHNHNQYGPCRDTCMHCIVQPNCTYALISGVTPDHLFIVAKRKKSERACNYKH